MNQTILAGIDNLREAMTMVNISVYDPFKVDGFMDQVAWRPALEPNQISKDPTGIHLGKIRMNWLQYFSRMTKWPRGTPRIRFDGGTSGEMVLFIDGYQVAEDIDATTIEGFWNPQLWNAIEELSKGTYAKELALKHREAARRAVETGEYVMPLLRDNSLDIWDGEKLVSTDHLQFDRVRLFTNSLTPNVLIKHTTGTFPTRGTPAAPTVEELFEEMKVVRAHFSHIRDSGLSPVHEAEHANEYIIITRNAATRDRFLELKGQEKMKLGPFIVDADRPDENNPFFKNLRIFEDRDFTAIEGVATALGTNFEESYDIIPQRDSAPRRFNDATGVPSPDATFRSMTGVGGAPEFNPAPRPITFIPILWDQPVKVKVDEFDSQTGSVGVYERYAIGGGVANEFIRVNSFA